MTMWERARSLKHCGLCGETIEIGQPLLLIRFDVSKRMDRIRCEKCVGHSAPPDLPDLIVHRDPPPAIDFGRVGSETQRRRQADLSFTPELDDEG